MARSVEIARAFITLEAETKGLDNQLSQAEKSLGRTAKFMNDHPIAAAVGLGVAILAAAFKATEAAKRFETAMAEVSTVVDTTTTDMKVLSDGVLDLFKSLPVKSLDDLTKGLYEVISAGIPASEALDFLRVAAVASVGGITSVNTAVDGLTTAVNVFASEGITAAKASDQFFVAVKLGKTTFEEISASIGRVAPTAKAVGISLEELLGTMAALTLGGLSTKESFTSIKAVISNIQKPTEDLLRNFPQLAKQFDLAALKSKGLAGFLTDLAKEVKGNDKATIAMFGSVEALNSVLSLTSDGGKRLNDILGQMNNSAGAADEAYEKMAGTTENLNQVLKNQLSATFIELGQTLLPAVNLGMRLLIEAVGLLINTANQGGLKRAAAEIKAIREETDGFKNLDAGNIGRLTEELGRLANNGRLLSQSVGVGDAKGMVDRFDAIGEALTKNLGKRSAEELHVLEDALKAVAASGSISAREAKSLADVLVDVHSMLVLKASTVKALTEAERKAVESSKKLTTEQKVAILTAKELTDVQRDQIAKALKEMAKGNVAGVTATKEQNDALKKLQEEAGKSQMELLTAQQRAYQEVERTFLEEMKKLTGTQYTEAERLLKQTHANQLLAWAGFGAKLDSAAVETVKTVVKIPNLVVPAFEDFNAILAEHGKVLTDDERKTIAARIAKEDLREALIEVAQTTAQAADALVGFAQDLGISTPELEAFAGGIANIADGIGRIASGDIIGGISQGLSGITGLAKMFAGESASSRFIRLALEHNSERLRESSRAIGNLTDLQTPGGQISKIENALTEFFKNVLSGQLGSAGLPNAGAVDRAALKALMDALSKQGIGAEQLDAFAKSRDLIIRDDKGRLDPRLLRQLLEEIADLEPTQFGTDFEGRRQQLRAETDLFNLTPAQQAAKLAALAAGFLEGLTGQTVGGLDFATAGGRESALDTIQKLFKAMQAGTIPTSELGGLTGKDLLEVLQELKGLLESANHATPDEPATEEPPAQQPPPSDEPTPVEDPVFRPDLEASNWEQLLGLQVEERDLLQGILNRLPAPGVVAPPPLPVGALGSLGASGALTVTFEGPIILQTQPGDDGESLAEQMMEFIKSDEGKRVLRTSLGEVLEEVELARGLSSVRF